MEGARSGRGELTVRRSAAVLAGERAASPTRCRLCMGPSRQHATGASAVEPTRLDTLDRDAESALLSAQNVPPRRRHRAALDQAGAGVDLSPRSPGTMASGDPVPGPAGCRWAPLQPDRHRPERRFRRSLWHSRELGRPWFGV